MLPRNVFRLLADQRQYTQSKTLFGLIPARDVVLVPAMHLAYGWVGGRYMRYVVLQLHLLTVELLILSSSLYS